MFEFPKQINLLDFGIFENLQKQKAENLKKQFLTN